MRCPAEPATRSAPLADQFRVAEVDQPHFAVGSDGDVVQFEVPMRDSLGVAEAQALGDFEDDASLLGNLGLAPTAP